MDIVRNFDELMAVDDLRKLNPKIFKYAELDSDILEEYVKLKYYLEDEDYIKLDKYIEEILQYYPQLVPCIVDSTQNKNRYSKVENFNKRNEEHFIRLIEEHRLYEAAQLYSSKEYERVSDQDFVEQNFYDHELGQHYCTIRNNLSQLATKEKVAKDIEKLLKMNFDEIIPVNETIVNLAKIITEELILRTQFPKDYIYTNEYKELSTKIAKDRLEKINVLHTQIIDLHINQSKSPEEILEILKKNI